MFNAPEPIATAAVYCPTCSEICDDRDEYFAHWNANHKPKPAPALDDSPQEQEFKVKFAWDNDVLVRSIDGSKDTIVASAVLSPLGQYFIATVFDSRGGRSSTTKNTLIEARAWAWNSVLRESVRLK